MLYFVLWLYLRICDVHCWRAGAGDILAGERSSTRSSSPQVILLYPNPKLACGGLYRLRETVLQFANDQTRGLVLG